MSKISFKLRKTKLAKLVNGIKTIGWYARLITNGTADFDDIVEIASMNTTATQAELRMSLTLCVNAIVWFLKKGMIIDLGPLGKIYPSVSSKWAEDPDDLKLSDVEGKVNFRASDDITGAVKNANYAWETKKDDKSAQTTDEAAGDTNEIENPSIIDSSTGTTVDTSTGGNPGGGDDIPDGNG
jgi:predicted histone-like DNA-binding protein